MTLLTAENYKFGFLVDDEVIGGVTEMADGVYSAYVSHYLTGETYAYQEFDHLKPALDFLSAIARPWVFEAVGCSKSSGKKACGGSSCGSGKKAPDSAGTCGTGGCGCK